MEQPNINDIIQLIQLYCGYDDAQEAMAIQQEICDYLEDMKSFEGYNPVIIDNFKANVLTSDDVKFISATYEDPTVHDILTRAMLLAHKCATKSGIDLTDIYNQTQQYCQLLGIPYMFDDDNNTDYKRMHACVKTVTSFVATYINSSPRGLDTLAQLDMNSPNPDVMAFIGEMISKQQINIII